MVAFPTEAGPVNVIPGDSPSVFEALRALQTANPQAYLAIVRPNNPPPGIGGFLLDIPGDQETRLRSAITRHFVESNTPIQDHIALEPEQVILRGRVAELVMSIPTQRPTQAVGNPLPILSVMQPPLTPAQQQAATQAASNQSSTTASLASQQSLWQFFAATLPGFTNLTRQSRAAAYFQQAWWGRQLFSVETPWGIWTNMAIADVRMLQPKESRTITDFTITFERIRVAGDITVNVGQLAGRNALQQAPATENGQAGAGTIPPNVNWFPPSQ